MGYRLAPDVTFCRPAGRTIFLDLRRDRYFCLDQPADAAFQLLVDGHAAASLPALAPVLNDGLLVPTPGDGVPRPCSPPATPASSAMEQVLPAGIAGTARMAAALAMAVIDVRLRPLHAIIADLKLRRARCGESVDAHRLRRLAGALDRTGLIASPLDRCLPRSLATARRMLDHQLAPTLVIAVKTGPFEAHSWVQHGAMVINDTVDRVRPFTPILVA